MEQKLMNCTYDEISVGQTSRLTKELTPQDIKLFGYMSGDLNPAHFDPEYAKNTMFKDVIGHGMWSGALISTVLGTQLPGPGTIYLGQTLKFSRPVYVGDVITTEVVVIEKKPKNRLTIECKCTNQRQEVVTSGTAEVIAPTEKISYTPPHFTLKDI